MWKTVLLACLLFYSCQASESPGFLVTFPAVIRAGSEAILCASLFHPNETLRMQVKLRHDDQRTLLLEERIEKTFHRCINFQAPRVKENSLQIIEVDVHGAAFSFSKESQVLFEPAGPLTLIKTDKPVYKPGQTVNFRVLSVDVNFLPVNLMYKLVELEDSNGLRIGQWTNATSNGRILQLSHPLNSEARLGTYKLSVWTESGKTEEFLKVMEYVLPKYKVTLDMPSDVNVMETERRLGVCSRYTYGQPVAGNAILKLCQEVPQYRRVEFNHTVLCHEESIKIDKNGCAFHAFNISYFGLTTEEHFLHTVNLHAAVEEEGTGAVLTEEGSINLNFEKGKLSFIETPDSYMNGSFFKGKVQAAYFNHSPIASLPVYLSVLASGLPMEVYNLTTDEDGVAHFSLNSTAWENQVLLTAMFDPEETVPMYIKPMKPHFSNADHRVFKHQPAFQKTESNELKIQAAADPLACGTNHLFRVKYSIHQGAVMGNSTEMYFLVLSRGAIVHHGQIQLLIQESRATEGEVSFQLAVTPELAPMVQIMVYSFLSSKLLLTNSMDFPTEKCLRNKVSLKFSPSEAVPGEAVSLHLTALPGSLCGLTAVDQSVLLLDPGKTLNVEKVFEMLPISMARTVPYNLRDSPECLKVREKRSVYYGYHGYNNEDTPFKKFLDLGLKTLNNLQLEVPNCLIFREMMYYLSRHPTPHVAYSVQLASASLDAHAPPQKPRAFFPETWVWDFVEVGDSGSALVPLTVPDTITSWDTEALCLSADGLGLAPLSQLKVFQPFFVELTLPYSIVRGEQFELKATVFNYLPKCIMVTVTATAAPSTQYNLVPSSDGLYTTCVCDRMTFRWTLVPTVLGTVNLTVRAEAVESQTMCDNEVITVPETGRVDTVIRPLLVKAEGEEKTVSHSWLLCPNGAPVKEEVSLRLPADMVEGSARASVSVLGDILGRALENLDGLLAMPYGCGEQNMALLSPNIYILEYLKATQQLTPAILEKATNFLKSGYQRQLRYQHNSGAYSTFGYGEGNSWLTAFVMRSFGRAGSFVYIDPKVINTAKAWLKKRQKPGGCFETVGKLFNNRMKGGVQDDVTLTAYIVASMLELKMSATGPVLNKSLSCLKQASHNLTDAYATALMAYTFSLSGDMDVRAMLMSRLSHLATAAGDFSQWSPPAKDSLSVEMSSYALLSILSQPQLSTSDLGYATNIVGWLVKQQNPWGGFTSTQDTVVALQALSLYATLTFNPLGSSTLKVTSVGGEQHHFTVDQSSKLLYQERALEEIPGQYSIEAEGLGCLSLQVALYYNIPPPANNSIFDVKVLVEGKCYGKRQEETINLTLQYKGHMETTNMVIMDVKMLSGFVPDKISVDELRRAVQRVDIEDDHVMIYLQEVSREVLQSYYFTVRQEVPVKNLKPAVVKVYDYYQPSDQTVVEYTSACEKGTVMEENA